MGEKGKPSNDPGGRMFCTFSRCPVLSLVLGCVRQGQINSRRRSTARSSVKRNVDLFIRASLSLFSAFSALCHLATPYWQVSCHQQSVCHRPSCFGETMESQSFCTRCLLSLVWALHEVVELLLIIFVKHVAILTDCWKRGNINSVNKSIPPRKIPK